MRIFHFMGFSDCFLKRFFKRLGHGIPKIGIYFLDCFFRLFNEIIKFDDQVIRWISFFQNFQGVPVPVLCEINDLIDKGVFFKRVTKYVPRVSQPTDRTRSLL